MLQASLILIVLGGLGAAATFVLHPAWVWAATRLRGRRPVARDGSHRPSVSAVIAFRGGEALVAAKVADLLAQDYPAERLQVLLVSDGPGPDPGFLPPAFFERGWQLLATGTPAGKNPALDLGVGRASGEVLLFSDPDARLAPDLLARLGPYFADPAVGGVCGRRVVAELGSDLDRAQADYVSVDSWIKRLESDLGFLTSNDGKLYAIRRSLYRPLDPAATDDLFNALSVTAAGSRMVFAPELEARIPKPSRNPGHEIARRRRIVARSLNGIWQHHPLLNPLRHGGFAVALLLNKVVRRLLPVFLLLVLAGLVMGAPESPWLAAGLMAAGLGLAAAGLHLPASRMGLPRALTRLTGLTFYIVVGNLGMLLGVWDFLRGKRVSTWTPIKAD